MKRLMLGAVIGSAGLVAAGSLAPAGALPPTTTPAARAATGGWTPSADSGATRVAILPTGDAIGVRALPHGAPHLSPIGAVPRGGLLTMRAGSTHYVIPRRVAPVVGSVLDPALFDVTALARRGSGRSAVTIAYASTNSPTAVPGVVVTSRTGTTGRGYVDAASSAGLGRELAAGGSASDLFAHVARVRVPTTPGANPAWPMITATIKVIGRDGAPGEVLVGYYNVNDPNKGAGMVFAERGKAKVSVPAGTYQLIASVIGGDGATSLGTSAETVVSAPRELVFDARKAVSTIRATLPRPATPGIVITSLNRELSGPHGQAGFSFGVIDDGSRPVYLTPTPGPLTGSQGVSYDRVAISPAGAPTPYTFVVHTGLAGKIPAGHIVHRATAANLTTYRPTFTGIRDLSAASFGVGVLDASGGWTIGMGIPARTYDLYASSAPGLVHGSELTQYQSFAEKSILKGQFSSGFAPAPAPGMVTARTWGAAPLHQSYVTPVAGGLFTVCPACIGGGVANFWAAPLSDAGHYGSADLVEPDILGRVIVKADDTTLYDGPGELRGGSTYPAGTQRISTTAIATRSGTPFPRATRMTTAVSTAIAASFPAPSGWACATATGCRVLPFLSLDYGVSGLDQLNALPAGARSVALTVKQVGRSTASGITGVKAWVSYDGRTWSPAPVTGSGARYAVRLSVPTPGAGRSAVSLKVSVTDAAGSTLTEQIDGAFGLAG